MQTALKMETTILPGHRLEITDPELPEGIKVEVIVVLPGTRASGQSNSLPQTPAELPTAKRQFSSALEFLESLPPGPRAFKTWEEYEQHLREERESWDRQ